MIRLYFCVPVILVLAAASVFAQEKINTQRTPHDELWKKVVQGWSQRRAKTKTVLYKMEGTTLNPKGNLSAAPDFGSAGPFPREDHVSPLSIHCLLDFENNRARKEKDWQLYYGPAKNFVRDFRIEVWTGTELKVAFPRGKHYVHPDVSHADLWVGGQNTSFFFDFVDWPFFLAHGSIPAQQTPQTKRLFVPVNSDDFRIVGPAVIGDSQCLIVVAKSKSGRTNVKYWVDPEKDGAVLRCHLTDEKDVADTTLDIDYKQHLWGWLPSNWSVSRMNSPPEVFRAYKLSAKEIIVNPSVTPKDFDVEVVPEMVVGDSPSDKLYVVQPDGQWKDYTKQSSSSYLPLLAIALLLAAVAIAAIWKWRLWKATNSQ
ncbi:MAG: hypothetical protein L0Y72_09535 [Gemmataceae bacterium]|nr:hypothetical protein [Gemmataceae bacterium]